MKDSPLVVNAFLSEPHLLQILVENLATSRVDSAHCLQRTPVGLKAIGTASVECYATIDLDIRSAKDFVKLPVNYCFLFTCSRIKGGSYQLTWIRSLS